MTSAEVVFKNGFAPVLGPAKLTLLRDACRRDDVRLTQRDTTIPSGRNENSRREPVECACAIAFALWQGDGLATTGEVEDAFADVCRAACWNMASPTACRWFLNAWDSTPRPEMLATLAGWIDDVLAADEKGAAA